jgi:hypothetical protein
MANGVGTNNLDSVPLSDEVLVNKDGSTGRQKTEDLATQLAGSGAIAQRLAPLETRATDLETSTVDQETRLAGLENGTYAEAIPFATTAAGISDTVQGQRFKVDNADPDVAYDVYLHDAGAVATFIESQPSVAALSTKEDKETVAKMMRVGSGNTGSLLDKYGFQIGSLGPFTGIEFIFGGLAPDLIENDLIAIKPNSVNAIQNLDKYGFLLDLSQGEDAPSVTQAVENRDAINIAASNLIKTTPQQIQRHTCDFNGHGAYGQSFSNGSESRAQLSTVAMLGNLMIGDSVKATGATSEEWVQRGVAQFNPMMATDTAYFGETALEGDANAFKKLMSNHFMSPQLSQAIVSFTAGIGGIDIDGLTKGADPDYYNRYTDAIALLKALADGEGGSSCLASMQLMMSQTGNGEAQSSYEPKLRTMIADLQTDAITEFGQVAPPAIYLMQPGSNYTSDAGDFGVHMSHLEVQDMQGVYVVGPQYGYPRYGAGHWNANSYRWYGAQVAKVRFRTQVLGLGWHPLQPRQAEYDGTDVYCDFLVPHPPLQFESTWVGDNPPALTDLEAKGFRLEDSTGTVAITSVEIVGDTAIKITPTVTLTGNAYLWYGDSSHDGAGNLVDSDPWVHPYAWETVAEVNGNGGENIPELVGEIYSGVNRCVQFRMPITDNSQG